MKSLKSHRSLGGPHTSIAPIPTVHYPPMRSLHVHGSSNRMDNFMGPTIMLSFFVPGHGACTSLLPHVSLRQRAARPLGCRVTAWYSPPVLWWPCPGVVHRGPRAPKDSQRLAEDCRQAESDHSFCKQTCEAVCLEFVSNALL